MLINEFINQHDLKIDEIQSDGVDVDFGNLIFENIYCTNIKNDCLDLSKY